MQKVTFISREELEFYKLWAAYTGLTWFQVYLAELAYIAANRAEYEAYIAQTPEERAAEAYCGY